MIQIDRQFMAKEGIDLTTPVILTNKEDYILTKVKEDNEVDKDDCVMTLIKR